MFTKGRKIIDRVWSMLDKPSTSMQNSRHLFHLGNIEETDILGASLHKEATTGKRKNLKKILSTAICVDYPNDLGQTPLFCACARENESTALLLLQWRANPNEKSVDGMTPCHVASFVGNVQLLGHLIEAGGDLRLHDNNGNSVRDWAVQNTDTRKRLRMLEFIDKIHMNAMAYNGDTADAEMLPKYAGRCRPHKQTSVMEIMMMNTGSDINFENLTRAQSTGFGRIYLGSDGKEGIISVVPLVSEAALHITDKKVFDTGFYTYMERMQWLNEAVSVKQLKPDVGVEDGIDLLIADAEFIGKLRHPNILLLMGICQSVSFDRIMLVFEHVENATLHFFLHETTKSLPFHDCMSIMHQVCAAMVFIHRHNLIHCGLSSMAVYLVSPHNTKVGNCEFMVESYKADLGKLSPVSLESHGELLYNWMSPELIQGLAPHYSSDVYSYCCIVWEIFTREVPWATLKPQNIRKKVVENGIHLSINNAKIPPKIRAIIGYGLELREDHRLNKFEFISEWLKTNQIPKFQRTNTIQYLKNKSGNFADQLYSSSSASFCSSSSSMKNEPYSTYPETWAQDRLYFNKDSQGPTLTQRPSERFHLSPSTVAAESDPPKKSLINRKFPSENDLEHDYQCLKPIKPASHLQCLNQGDLPSRNDGCQFNLFERNNSGKPYSWDTESAFSREYASQPHFGNSDDSLGMLRSSENVRRLADFYQLQMNQHKLRQAILKGSMAPKGSCQELETSSDSIKSACNRQTVGDKCQIFKGDVCEACHLKSSTPKERLISAEVEQHPLSENTDAGFEKIFYISKITRNVCTSCDSKGREQEDEQEEEEEDCQSGLRPWQVADGVSSRCNAKVIRRDVQIKSNEVWSHGHGENEIHDSSHTHRMFLQEIRTAYQKIGNRSLCTDNTQSSLGVCYHSPNIETISSDERKEHNTQSYKCALLNRNSAQGDTERSLAVSAPNSSGPSETAVRKDLGDIVHGRTEMDGSLLPVNYDFRKYDNINYELGKTSVNLGLVKADLTENRRPVLGMGESGQSCADTCERQQQKDSLDKCNRDFLFHAGDHYDNQPSDHITDRTYQDVQLADGDEVGHNQCLGKAVLNETFTVVPDDETVGLISSHVLDFASSTHNTSMDSDGIGQWVDTELDKIKWKMGLKSHQFDHGTESSGSLHGLKDISPASTLREDGDNTVKNRDVHILDSRVDGDLELGSQKNSRSLQKMEFAKTLLEDDGSCDFEFHEFYIDDDFESAEHIQQDTSSSKVSILDCNASTRHTADDSGVATVITNRVENEEEYFLHAMTNVKPPVFPRKLKRTTNISQENFTCTTLSGDNAGKVEDKIIAERSIIDEDTIRESESSFQCMDGLPKDVPASRAGEDALVKTRTTTSLEGPQNGSDLTISCRTRHKLNKCENKQEDDTLCQIDKDTVIGEHLEECTIINERNNDVTDYKTLPESSNILNLASGSQTSRITTTEKPCISVNTTKSSSRTTDVPKSCMTRKDCCRTGVKDGSDSDSDDWVKMKVISIQEKIQRRRARLTYSISSDENSGDEDGSSCAQSPAKRIGRNSKTFSRDFDSTINWQDEDQAHLLHSECVKNTVKNSGQTKVMDFLKYNSQNQQSMHRLPCSATEKSIWDEIQQTGDLTMTKSSSYLNTNKQRCSKSKLTSHLSSKRQSTSSSPTYHQETNEEIVDKKYWHGGKNFSVDHVITPATSRQKNKSCSKMPQVICMHGTDTSKINIGDKSSMKSMDQSIMSDKLWKSHKKDKDLFSETGKIIPQEGKKKSHRSILRRPISLIRKVTDTQVNTVSNLIPSPVELSTSKFSVGHDSKASDKVISFQGIGITDIDEEKSDLKQMPLSSKLCSILGNRTPQDEESFDSFPYNKNVKTWLERENFAESCSLASSRQDHQSITSRVMEVQSMSSRQLTHEVSIPASGLHAKQSSQSKSFTTSKQDISHKHETGGINPSPRGSKDCVNPTCKEMTRVRTQNGTEKKSAGLGYTQDPQYLRHKSYQSLSKQSSQKRSLDQDHHTRETFPMSQSHDHCLTLDVKTPSREGGTGVASSLKSTRKQSHVGFHRFYIPHEMYQEGYTAKMNIQISQAHPAAQRITTTTTDPVSGLTEILLDQTVFTHKLRSTMQLD